jgi:putative transposase
VFLSRISALIAVEHGSRRAHLARVTAHPTGAWTTPAARNLLRDLGDRVATSNFLLQDRDSRFTRAFDAAFAADGIRILTSPPGAPQANAMCERMIASTAPRAAQQGLGRERTPPTPDPHDLPHHFNAARPHRTLAQLTPAQAETQPPPAINLASYQVRHRPREVRVGALVTGSPADHPGSTNGGCR